MIDGIKILHLIVNISELLQNEFLEFIGNHSTKTGEVNKYPLYSKYNEMEFLIRDNSKQIKKQPDLNQQIYVNLNGSLHKYHNKGLHNYNDYFFTDLQQTIYELSEKFKINPDRSQLNNLEFGVNIQTKYTFEEVKRSIVNYKGTAFHPFTIPGAKGIECAPDNYIIKIYDKGHQYNQPGNLLRIEIKVRKMKFFANRKININSLANLLDYSEIVKLGAVLKGAFDKILFTDYNIDQNKLTPSNRLILSQGSNPKHWEQLKPKSKDFKNGNKDKEYISKRKKYHNEHKRFEKLIAKYSTSPMQRDISFLIEKKCNELLKFDCKTVDKFPDYKTTSKNDDSGQIHISNIVGYCPPSEITTRLCLTCGNDISKMRKGAKYCSKKCKNNYTNPILNPKNNLLRRLGKINRYPVLFDVSLYTVLSEQQRELLGRVNSIKNRV